MSIATAKMSLTQARIVSGAIVAALEPGCETILVAGSIRREKPDIGDIEIVAIPKRSTDLMGEPGDSLLDPILDLLVFDDRLVRIKGGDKYKQFWVKKAGCKLDLFLAEASNWGLILAIRTGPAEFSKRLVTPRKHGGLLPSHLKVKDGRVWDGDKALVTGSEAELFRILGMKPIEAKNR